MRNLGAKSLIVISEKCTVLLLTFRSGSSSCMNLHKSWKDVVDLLSMLFMSIARFGIHVIFLLTLKVDYKNNTSCS